MPSTPFVPPDMRTWDGRGWEPERTYHTPRGDARSAKSVGGRHDSRPSAVPAPDWYGAPGVRSTRAGGQGGHYSPAQEPPVPRDWPQKGQWGQANSNVGFSDAAGLRPLHGDRERQAWEAPLRRSTPPPSFRRPRQLDSAPAHPIMMDGMVALGGLVPDRNLHHVLGYESPDRALVGEEEAAMRAKVEKARHRERARSPHVGRDGGLGDQALRARQRALAAAEKRRIHVPAPSSGHITNTTHVSLEPRSQRVATPTTMSRSAGY